MIERYAPHRAPRHSAEKFHLAVDVYRAAAIAAIRADKVDEAATLLLKNATVRWRVAGGVSSFRRDETSRNPAPFPLAVLVAGLGSFPASAPQHATRCDTLRFHCASQPFVPSHVASKPTAPESTPGRFEPALHAPASLSPPRSRRRARRPRRSPRSAAATSRRW